jgi:biopolymer transport protein ExbD
MFKNKGQVKIIDKKAGFKNKGQVKIIDKKAGFKSKRQEKVIDPKADLTSMIDVTFLLLVFFAFNMTFGSEEGSIDAYLPKNSSIGVLPRTCYLDIRIKLLWKTIDGKRTTDEDAGHTVLKIGRKEYNLPGDLDSSVVNSPVWKQLGKDLRKFKSRSTLKSLPVIIDARQQVPHKHVMSALNEVIGAGVDDVTFAAPEHPY